ncbi:hypothetical protein SAMN05421740_10479 [Parapedobacter koreensis]|uniref:Uncharacterized protein n=1 Tax=Parapedobacter koreensis TaxID=332977 RepID=A0A1H7NRZ8_9SPHI|nr:hypothetical protein SAMN05421740_10479 [Parapedobacter koreensis]
MFILFLYMKFMFLITNFINLNFPISIQQFAPSAVILKEMHVTKAIHVWNVESL